MSHIANLRGSHWLEQAVGRPWACVMVRVDGRRRLVVEAGSIGVLKSDTLVAPLPEEIEVYGPDDERIRPARGRFYITTETFDPYHALTDGVP